MNKLKIEKVFKNKNKSIEEYTVVLNDNTIIKMSMYPKAEIIMACYPEENIDICHIYNKGKEVDKFDLPFDAISLLNEHYEERNKNFKTSKKMISYEPR
jgi:hypothetical protein